ncbi:MAG: Nif11-like leader peptide family natural product precursor [Prosthecochloris sp.]|nr:Nif11-like leader peptide family natural product precursor [Prosthecochloris sp.]
MSQESAKAFLDRIGADANFCNGLVSQLAARRMELIREAGFDFTEEELEEAKSSLPPGALGHVAGWFCDVEKDEREPFRGRKCGGGVWH